MFVREFRSCNFFCFPVTLLLVLFIFLQVQLTLAYGDFSTSNRLQVFSLNNKYLGKFVDGDLVKVVLSLTEWDKVNYTLSTGYSFHLTASHPSLISISDKYCVDSSGREVLVVKRAADHYLLTAVRDLPTVECSFSVQTFYDTTAPSYSLYLSSPDHSVLKVDWTGGMYEGEVNVRFENTKEKPTSYVVYSPFVFTLDTKTKSVGNRFIPLKFSFAFTPEVSVLLNYKGVTEMNVFSVHFSNCSTLVDNQEETVVKFHTQNMQQLGSYLTARQGSVQVLAEVVSSDYTHSVTRVECTGNLRHFLTSKIVVEFDEERYFSPPITYSPVGQLFMAPSVNQFIELTSRKIVSVTALLVGRELYSEYSVTLGGDYYQCITLKGLRTTSDEYLNIQQRFKLVQYIDRNITADLNLDRDELVLTSGSLESFTFPLYSASASLPSDVSWAPCHKKDEPGFIPEYSPVTSLTNPVFGLDFNKVGKGAIYVRSAEPMTSMATITVEIEEVMRLDKLSLNIKTPYRSEMPGLTSIHSICQAYNTTDRVKINSNPHKHFKSYLYSKVDTLDYGDNRIRMAFKDSQYRKLVICKLYPNYIGTHVDVELLSGLSAEISIGNLPVTIHEGMVEFHHFIGELNQITDVIPLSTVSETYNIVNTLNVTISDSSNLYMRSIDSFKSTSNTNVNATPPHVISGNNEASHDVTSDKNVTPPHVTSDNNEAFMKITVADPEHQSFLVSVANLPVSITHNPSVGSVFSFYLSLNNTNTRFFSKIFMTSPETGKLAKFDEGSEKDNRWMVLLTIVNHPTVVQLYQDGETEGVVDFDLYFTEGTDLNYIHDNLVSLESLGFNLLTTVQFPLIKFFSFESYITDHKETKLTTVDTFMERYLSNESSTSPTTYIIIINSKYPLKNANFFLGQNGREITHTDFISDFSITANISPEIDNLAVYTSIQFNELRAEIRSEVVEYEEEVEFRITISTLTYYPRIFFNITTQYDNFRNMVISGGIPDTFTVGMPQVLSVGGTIDANRLDPYLYSLDISFPDLWKEHYLKENTGSSYSDFNVFNSKTEPDNEMVTIKRTQRFYPVSNIPSDLSIPLCFNHSNVRYNNTTTCFNTRFYLPDSSHISSISRVIHNMSSTNNSIISPHDEHFDFAFSGFSFNLASTLTININQVPLKVIRCLQDGVSTEVTLEEANILSVVVKRDLNSDLKNYEQFRVMCEFKHLSSSEITRERYSGVFTASLSSQALGQTYVTSLSQAYSLAIAREKKDRVVFNSVVTIRDTGETGISPDEVSKLLEGYESKVEKVTGGRGDVYIDSIHTYPTEDSEYDTDIDMVIRPPLDDSDYSLDLTVVQDINDQFMTEATVITTKDISVSTPSYSVEIDECKNKCGAGCRLCGEGVACNSDRDCLFNTCNLQTHKCTVQQTLDNNHSHTITTGNANDYVYLFIAMVLFFS